MLDKIKQISEAINKFEAKNLDELELFRLKYLSKKGIIPSLFDDFRNVSNEDKRIIGVEINNLKNQAQTQYNALKSILEDSSDNSTLDIDVTRPGDPLILGSRHPLSIVRKQIVDIFSYLGYAVADGPEIEDDAHNFAMMNFPIDHPARDMQDTFFISENMNILLRTHTSSCQAREMESTTPPIRSIYPGRVYRNEAISARAHCLFHQVEGLYVDKNVSFADLKHDLSFFAKSMFGEDAKIRLRPSYFPFTEPSAELDVSCTLCKGKGCNVCKGAGWLEILGCGMVDPNVFDATGIDKNIYSGFAFGMGIERIAMLKYEIKDLRMFYENDIRFLSQFTAIT